MVSCNEGCCPHVQRTRRRIAARSRTRIVHRRVRKGREVPSGLHAPDEPVVPDSQCGSGMDRKTGRRAVRDGGTWAPSRRSEALAPACSTALQVILIRGSATSSTTTVLREAESVLGFGQGRRKAGVAHGQSGSVSLPLRPDRHRGSGDLERSAHSDAVQRTSTETRPPQRQRASRQFEDVATAYVNVRELRQASTGTPP